MTTPRLRGHWLLAGLVAGCVHTRGAELTVEEHQRESRRHQEVAAAEIGQYDAKAKAYVVPGRSPFDDTAELGAPWSSYNPTAGHLRSAEQHWQSAHEHQVAARELEAFEDSACRSLSRAQRSACPFVTPYTARVEETARGVRLHLKPDAPGRELAAQMKCHLAFATARGFDRTSCPLYVKGVTIEYQDDNVIEVHTQFPARAAEVRRQARLLFVPGVSAVAR